MGSHLSIRFLVGLSSAHDAPGVLTAQAIQAKRRARVLRFLGERYGFGGAYDGSGYWQGSAEPCLSWEVILPRAVAGVDTSAERKAHAQSVARELARIAQQEAIGLVFTEVEYQEVKPLEVAP